jgi:hypothetical protein
VSTLYICESHDHSLSAHKNFSEENALVLSESLKEDALRILVDAAISSIFPKQCEELNVATTDARYLFGQESEKRQAQVHRDLSRQESSLRFALRDKVVDDVIEIFPCVVFCWSLSILYSDGFLA